MQKSILMAFAALSFSFLSAPAMALTTTEKSEDLVGWHEESKNYCLFILEKLKKDENRSPDYLAIGAETFCNSVATTSQSLDKDTYPSETRIIETLNDSRTFCLQVIDESEKVGEEKLAYWQRATLDFCNHSPYWAYKDIMMTEMR